jgi:hypothetical protein
MTHFYFCKTAFMGEQILVWKYSQIYSVYLQAHNGRWEYCALIYF